MPVEIAPIEKILYRSTNSPEMRGSVDFRTALLAPETPDGGLYVPERIPVIDSSVTSEFGGMDYPGVSYHVLRAWFTKEEIPDRKLREMTEGTFTWPIDILSVGGNYCADFSKGPTLSFKDPGTSGSAMLTEHFRPENETLVCVDSTSGDTGPANAHAQYRRPITVFVYFPYADVSEFQRRQMTTLLENIHAIGILASKKRKGDFDTCQWTRDCVMGDMRTDPRAVGIKVITGNSKSIGRFLPQVTYWHYLSSKLCADTGAEKANVYVGFGNAGNFTSAIYAKRMGAPIGMISAISNENDEFDQFMQTGKYLPKSESIKCPSTAMMVANPSNMARIFDLFGGNVDRNGTVHREPDIEMMRREIRSASVSNAETSNAIRDAYHSHGVVLDPHGAVAYNGMLKLQESDRDLSKYPGLFTETAAPAKFPVLIQEELGFEPQLPAHLKGIYEKPERVYLMEPDVPRIKAMMFEILGI